MSLSSALLTTLYNNAGIQALISSVGTPPHYAIYSKTVLPDNDGLTTDSVTINFYGGNMDHGMEYAERAFTVNCRAPKEETARLLAKAVVEAANRNVYKASGVFFVSATLFPIPPNDGTDNFNYVVETLVRARMSSVEGL